ncbi:MAG: hypothetical protein Q4E53_05595 [Eubacteriales bacterium]|nr:hypothetical protein [Eubacteriales bacterium]
MAKNKDLTFENKTDKEEESILTDEEKEKAGEYLKRIGKFLASIPYGIWNAATKLAGIALRNLLWGETVEREVVKTVEKSTYESSGKEKKSTDDTKSKTESREKEPRKTPEKRGQQKEQNSKDVSREKQDHEKKDSKKQTEIPDEKKEKKISKEEAILAKRTQRLMEMMNVPVERKGDMILFRNKDGKQAASLQIMDVKDIIKVAQSIYLYESDTNRKSHYESQVTAALKASAFTALLADGKGVKTGAEISEIAVETEEYGELSFSWEKAGKDIYSLKMNDQYMLKDIPKELMDMNRFESHFRSKMDEIVLSQILNLSKEERNIEKDQERDENQDSKKGKDENSKKEMNEGTPFMEMEEEVEELVLEDGEHDR